MFVDRDIHIPAPGTPYLHYKGGSYVVLTVGRLSEQRDQLCVVYRSNDTHQVWIRPLGMWSEKVVWPDGILRPRFDLAGLQNKAAE